MQLTWFGHSTWRVQVGETTLLIDPFFDNPKTDTDPEAIDPDHVLLTHGHADHVADVDRYPDAHFVATPELTGYLADTYGLENGTGMNLGGTFEAGDAYVTMHRADHTNGIESGYEASAGMPAGYLISDAAPTRVEDAKSETFYHAGDTALFSEMRDVIGPYLEPDAAALPIGDHFTMGPEQAAIAVDWLDPAVAFPMHYDTFPPIEQDPEEFRREVSAIGSDADVELLSADDPYDLSANL